MIFIIIIIFFFFIFFLKFVRPGITGGKLWNDLQKEVISVPIAHPGTLEVGPKARNG